MNRVFLIGMPGSGKTTLGKSLSSDLKIPFYDLDEIITTKTGKSINQIFNESGENTFRALESKYLNELIKNQNQFILATGGGTPCFNNNINVILKNGRSVYLKVSREELFKRLKRKIDHRPLLKDKTEENLIEEIKDKLYIRSTFYEQSNYIIESDSINVSQIIEVLKE